MKRNPTFLMCSLLLGAGLYFPAAMDAQEQPGSEPPKAPAKVYGPIGAGDQQDPNAPTETLQPDNRPLTGFQQPTVGAPPEKHSYWVPGVSYHNFIQSSGQTQGGESGWNSTSYLTGNISLLENWSRSQLNLNLSAGGSFSTDSTIGSEWYTQLNASQVFHWQRLDLTLLDEFAYLPQSQFGFGAGSGLSLPGVGGSLGGGGTGIAPGFSPGQSIFTAIGPRYVNTAGVQMNYALTRRSSFTVGGLYNLVRFQDPGNIDSDTYVGIAGYNYQITRNNTVGLAYHYSSYHYLASPQAIGDQMFQAAFGRKITGRLALQVTGGPEVTNFRVAQPPATKTRYVAGSGSATLTYAVERGSFSATYFHGLTVGSGVFLGATTDQVTGTANRRLSRVWSGDAHVGFARNRNAETAPGVPQTNYNTVYAGAAVGRPLGRNANFSLAYTAYVETASSTICTGPSCDSSFTTHQITIGLNWHARPFVLR
jgi:hypothetical protein